MLPRHVLALPVLLAFAACGRPAAESRLVDQGAQATGGKVPLVSVETSPHVWTAAAGWTLGPARILGDLDGDGYMDAHVSASDGVTGWSGLLFGPLRGGRVLPGDEDVAISGPYSITGVADYTGDGVVDLDVDVWDELDPWGTEPVHAVLPGPFAGAVDTTTAIAHPGIVYLEVNGDGIMDQVRVLDQDEQIEFVWGPPSRWTAEAAPDLVIAPACDSSNAWALGQVPKVFPDVTGDGAPELLIAGYPDPDDWRAPCSHYLLSLPADGVYDLVGTPAGLTQWAQDSMEVVPDQSGDGLADLYVLGSVYAAPVTFEPGGLITSATVYTVDPALSLLLEPQPFDADGDGLADFLGYDSVIPTSWSGVGPGDGETNETMFLVSGGPNLPTTQLTEGWDLAGGTFGTGWVEDGTALVLVKSDRGHNVVEVGPATAMNL